MIRKSLHHHFTAPLLSQSIKIIVQSQKIENMRFEMITRSQRERPREFTLSYWFWPTSVHKGKMVDSIRDYFGVIQSQNNLLKRTPVWNHFSYLTTLHEVFPRRRRRPSSFSYKRDYKWHSWIKSRTSILSVLTPLGVYWLVGDDGGLKISESNQVWHDDR